MNSYVYTERTAHLAWAALVDKNPTAACLLHLMVSQMGPQNLLIAQHKTFATMMGRSVRTVARAVKVLIEEEWIKRVAVNGVNCGYAINPEKARSKKTN